MKVPLKPILLACFVLLTLPVFLFGGDVSYVLLYKSGPDSLVRISADGQSRKVIATGAGGVGLAADQQGNYIVATVNSLLRVSASGAVSTIAYAPIHSQWMRVAVDSNGNYIVVDNHQHAIWRVSPDGGSVKQVAAYPVENEHELEDAGILIGRGGDYIVIDGNTSAHLWRITPEGAVIALPLHGEKMRSGCCLVADGSGGYFAGSLRDHAFFHIAQDGEVTKFASVSGINLAGLARNPDTGEFVATLNFDPALRKISPDGSSVTEFTSFGRASDILVESGK